MEFAKVILQYVQAILSWPVATFTMAAMTFWIFRSDIKLLIGRIAEISLPGGSKVSMSQTEQSAKEAKTTKNPEVPEAEANKPLNLPADVNLTPEQLTAVRQLYLAERANAYLWEYKYLNYFLAYRTQQVLDWFVTTAAPVSRSLFDNVWMSLILEVEERQAILAALNAHYLIMLNGDLISVTPKGREYQAWRGALPPRKAILPSTAST